MVENDLENEFRPEGVGKVNADKATEAIETTENGSTEKPESLGRRFLNFHKELIKNADFGVLLLEGVAAVLAVSIGTAAYDAVTTDWEQVNKDYEKAKQEVESQSQVETSLPDTAVIHSDGKISLENTQTPAASADSERSSRAGNLLVTYAAGAAALWGAHEMMKGEKGHGW